jgi:chromosome segregation ATPase
MNSSSVVRLQATLTKVESEFRGLERELRTIKNRVRELEVKEENLRSSMSALKDDVGMAKEQADEEDNSNSALQDEVLKIAGELCRLSDDLWMHSQREGLPQIAKQQAAGVAELLQGYYKDLESSVP